MRLLLALWIYFSSVLVLTPWLFMLFEYDRPAGLNVTDDNKLQGILDELENWKIKLPPELQFRGPETPISAGEFLHA